MKRVLKILLCLPFVLVGLVVLYEVAGMAVNHVASARQTAELVRLLETGLPQVEVIDRYTETGNTVRTGNHVDMLTAVIFRAEAEAEEIEWVMQSYDDLDGWMFWVEPLSEALAVREKYPEVNPFLKEMRIPEDLENCWFLYRNASAPFVDNIEGH